MKVVLTGGGTAGHITPLLAVAHELKKQQPQAYIIYVGERGGKFSEMLAGNVDIDQSKSIFAGKLRRYHGESWLRRLTDIPTIIKNIRDVIFLGLGTIEAVLFLRRERPDVVLLKGGFVGVPVGLAAALWRIPFVTHDSDPVPGLANRLVARWASRHATALAADKYSYPNESVAHVGVLVGNDYEPISHETQQAFKHAVGAPVDSTVLLVTGGSSGAVSLNQACKQILPKLFDDYQKLYVIHQVGKGKAGVYQGYTHPRLQVEELLFPLYEYTGASDLVITRAGANALAELGVQGRACIVVPSAHLTGGHQLKNAAALEEKGAVLVVKDTTTQQTAGALNKAVRELLDDAPKRDQLGKKLQEITIPDATQKLTTLLIDIAKIAKSK